MDEIDPLGVFLVKSGSKGDRLLFRYPFLESFATSEFCTKKNAVSTKDKGEVLWSTEENNQTKWDVPGLFNFDDKVLSNLFAVKPELCGQQFELKIENVRFVGHPTYLSHATSRELSTLTMFHIVFALKASASHALVNNYHELSRNLSIAVHFEERRCNFLTQQVKLMQLAHDEVASLPEDIEESPFRLILKKSKLAMNLKQVYEEMKNSGTVHVNINDWNHMSFCLPIKVHKLYDIRLNIGRESVMNSLKVLRPYHGILLLEDVNELLASLPDDTSPALIRLIRVYTPLKNLQNLAADADVILSNVFHLVSHLVLWCKGIIIYPLCDSNIYMVAPHASRSVHSPLVKQFSERFPNKNLLVVLSQFSLPTSLSLLTNPMNLPSQQSEQVQMVIWLLQHRFLIQLHTYVVFLPAIPELPNSESIQTSEISNKSSTSESDDDFSFRERENYRFSGIPEHEMHTILRESIDDNSEDLKNFLRLILYFDGHHHLEEIMYCENIRRSQLLKLLEKYNKILITYQCEDEAVAAFHDFV